MGARYAHCRSPHSLISGFALSLIGAILFILGQITLFALLYTLGVVCSLVGTGFLLGFWKQCKMMMDPVRIYAAGEAPGSLSALPRGGTPPRGGMRRFPFAAILHLADQSGLRS